MKATVTLLLVAAGLVTAALAGATPAQSTAPEASAAAPATTPSWAEPIDCDTKAVDVRSLFNLVASPTATDMCGSCNVLLCKNVPLNAGCTIGNHRGHCVSLGNK